jgi:hypothetical protein
VKYFSLDQIKESLGYLSGVHPFFLFTFPAVKSFKLPVGSTVVMSMDGLTDHFLRDRYKLHPKSDWFFSPFRGANRSKAWLSPRYASTGLQAINTQTFRDAFEHPPNSPDWGWSRSYIAALKKHLPRRKRILLLHLVVWLERNTPYLDDATRKTAVKQFHSDFHFTGGELSELFDTAIVSKLSESDAFQKTPAKWEEIIANYPMPPDIGPETETVLRFLALQSLGPLPHLELHPASRLNLITGDNGVGKTFLLDAIWWALTNDWVEYPILPRASELLTEPPTITFRLAGNVDRPAETATYDSKNGWVIDGDRSVVGSLVLYSRSDGAFAVWDPIRDDVAALSPKIALNRDEVWIGKGRSIEGLLRDLVTWFTGEDKALIGLFLRALARLSPPEMDHLELGNPVRVIGFSQRVPTLRHPYGEVPIVFESAGIKRMVALAYLIVWAWTEHRAVARDRQRSPARKLVLMVDELEAHLHPKWQRTVLPALLGVLSDLSSDINSQIFIATHSPLVAASMESDFQRETDSFFTLDLRRDGTADFKELDYHPRGPMDAWLISPAFGLEDARSIVSASAIRDAEALQEQEQPNHDEVKTIHERLVKLLPASDRFWPRWLLFAKKHGVTI